MKYNAGNSEIELVQGDITEMDTVAIVNAANAQLQLGGGVAGAIRQKGGPSIQEQCNEHGPRKVGEAAVTGAGNLKAEFVIHAVGPRMGEGDENEKLRSATLNSLKVAEENNITSLCFPAISTGIFGFPIERCANIMLSCTIEYLQKGSPIKKVVFCLFGDEFFRIFKEELKRFSG